MPDLTIVTSYSCVSNRRWHTSVQGQTGKYDVEFFDGAWTCTCPHFVHRGPVECKHIIVAQRKRCGWGWEAYGGGNGQEPTVVKDDDGSEHKVCPDCLGPVEPIDCAV